MTASVKDVKVRLLGDVKDVKVRLLGDVKDVSNGMAYDKRLLCVDCGQLVLNLWNHGCPASKKAKQETRHLTRPEQQKIMSKSVKSVEVKQPPPLPALPTKKRKEKPSTERNKRWRAKNPDRYRAYMKSYMQKWRASPNE